MSTYNLVHWVIHKYKNGTAIIYLYGERSEFVVFKGKHVESIRLRRVPKVTGAELVRCAVTLSPNTWKVSVRKDMMDFGGKFYIRLDEQLRAKLMENPNHIKS